MERGKKLIDEVNFLEMVQGVLISLRTVSIMIANCEQRLANKCAEVQFVKYSMVKNDDIYNAVLLGKLEKAG